MQLFSQDGALLTSETLGRFSGKFQVKGQDGQMSEFSLFDE
jgi:hypothetical protein